ncbi:methyltransferase domain-containing protein [Streptomyces sp. NPDC097619]|uniref:methyltransferase domain-containing protein n=1 Tax=Streptomyces sp. NPDC097619 TaxID=3157228 RepID=UPI00332F7244
MAAGADSGRAGWKAGVRRLLARTGFDIVRSTDNLGGVDDFLPYEPTLRAARKAGLSVGDYLDEVVNGTPGATLGTIDELRRVGVYAHDPRTVLEIGPGSGRYLEKTLKECSPDRYEIYETAAPWAAHLVENFGVVALPAAGSSLAPTPDGSVDLVQAHKVFNTVTFLCAVRYFFEMARVTRPGGRIVFDVLTENCLDPTTVETWATKGGEGHGSFPAAMPRRACTDLFESLGCRLEAAFTAPLGVATTEVLVFEKRA